MTVLVLFTSILVGVALAEISFRVFGGTWFHTQLRIVLASLQLFREAIGDDARQELLLRSGRMTLKFSLVVLGVLVFLAVIAVVAPWVLEWTESQQTVYLVVTSLAATGWWLIRRPRRNSSSTQNSANQAHAYGTSDRWLHWLALEPESVRQLTFDLERQFALPNRAMTDALNNVADPAAGAVYVCGLARSGTTMLLHILDQVDVFKSLTYRDMPFVLAPNLWKQLTRHARQESVLAERAHGDGIHVDFDSPEGFEEVFWRTFGKQTSELRCLGVDDPSPEVLATFSDYRALVANPRTRQDNAHGVLKRYLSKNNNNLLRLRSLCVDPTATVLLVYRNPVDTARSLHRQHVNFCASQADDRFTRTYMGWLAHHEFGLDHLPFCFAVPNMDMSRTTDDPNYWLDYWNAVYGYVLAQQDVRYYLVNHGALCAEPEATLSALFNRLGVQADSTSLAKRINKSNGRGGSDEFCPELLHRAEATYRALLESPKNLFRPVCTLSTK